MSNRKQIKLGKNIKLLNKNNYYSIFMQNNFSSEFCNIKKLILSLMPKLK